MRAKKKEFVTLQQPAKGKGKYYLTNKDLLPAVINAKKEGIFTDELARMLMLLANNYSHRSNFGGYSYREDMVSEALLNLAKNWHKFDETRGSNPFAFYTTAIRNSFLQYMNDETKQRYVRDTILVDHGLDPSVNFTGYLNEKERKKAEDEAAEAKAEREDTETEVSDDTSPLSEDIKKIKSGKAVIKNGILEY